MSDKITSAIAPGTVLHGEAYDYKIIKTLGQGTFGITYQAKVEMKGALGTLDSNMYVAVKEFFMKEVNGRSGDTVTSGSTSKGGLFSYYREKFEREARNLGTLKHPNIVRVLEMFIANGTAYYAMEFINGMSLDDTITKSPQGRLSTEQAIRLTRQIGAAISFMHSRKMLHLDVKPANVMVRADGKAVLIDCGANAECTPEYLVQFAYLGNFYAKRVLGVETPRVGLLNIGAEDSKGTELQKTTLALLRKADEAGDMHFIGNIEAKDAIKGGCDVIVTDGFSGNVMLKTIEGVGSFAGSALKGMFKKNLLTKLAALLVMPGLNEFKARLDPNKVGGTAFIGISKPVIKAHGGSNAEAIENAVGQAIQVAQSGIVDDIAAHIHKMQAVSE